MHSADYAVARCLSVCLSATRRYSVETAEHIIKVFSLSSSQTILVFLYQTGWQYSDAGVECKGGYETSSSAVAERLRDALCPSVVSLNKIITPADFYHCVTLSSA